MDVVPAGEGWSGDPFAMRRQDGWILGGACWMTRAPWSPPLYTLKCLKELGVPLRYPVRALAGTNEETGMKDVEYYWPTTRPRYSASPPTPSSPVCNGEKGHFHGKLVSPVCHGKILAFEGGVANNAVPDRASALVQADMAGLKNAPNITLEPENGCVRVRGWGKSGHAASPEGTVNAIGLVADYLLANGLCNEARAQLSGGFAQAAQLHRRRGPGHCHLRRSLRSLTIIGGRMYMQEGRMVQTMDSRYPTSTNETSLQPPSGPPSEPAPPWRTWTPPTPSISRRTPLPSGPASTPTTR